MPDLCAALVSLLPKLEPIAGGGLAINLAYLNLRRFRYRSQIRDHAKKEVISLANDKGEYHPKLVANHWFQQVQRFAHLKDNDEILPVPALPDTSQTAVKMPDGFWGTIYRYIFEYHQDRWLAFAFTGLCLVGLIFGVAHSIDQLTWCNCAFSADYIWISFWILLIAMILPVLLVFVGRRVVRWACKYASNNVRELEKLMKADVQKATLPV